MVGIVKSLFNKCRESNSDPYIALLQYRNTSQSTGNSPAQLLMSRSLRMKLPTSENLLKPKTIDYDQHNKAVKEKIAKMTEYHDQHAKVLPSLKEGDDVLYKKNPLSPWSPASVVTTSSEPRSFVIRTSEGVDYRRNRQHLLKPFVTPRSQSNQSVISQNNQSVISSTISPNPIGNDSQSFHEYVTRSGRHVIKPRRFSFTENDIVI